MSEPETSRIPARMGLLPDPPARRALTPAFLKGYEVLQHGLLEAGTVPSDECARHDVAELRRLVDDAVRLFEDRPTASDAWLAPRLHYVLRLTRVEATDTALWNFLALRVAPDYVRRRWGRPATDGRSEVRQSARFSGRWDVQCFSRLWWAAELFRDGGDYEPVSVACGNQDVLNTCLRLDLVRHRPVAQALVELLRREVVRTGRDVNGLARAASTAGSTLVYEVLAPDEPRDVGALQEWTAAADEDVPYKESALPEGPDDGCTLPKSVRLLTARFEELFATAPVRGRRTDSEPVGTEDEGVSLLKAYAPG
jgi:hypothetical protein